MLCIITCIMHSYYVLCIFNRVYYYLMHVGSRKGCRHLPYRLCLLLGVAVSADRTPPGGVADGEQ